MPIAQASFTRHNPSRVALRGYDGALLTLINDLCRASATAPSISELAAQCGCEFAQAEGSLDRLAALGHIRIERNRKSKSGRPLPSRFYSKQHDAWSLPWRHSPHGTSKAVNVTRGHDGAGPKKCMTCKTPFISSGHHHRMCNDCRDLAAESYTPFDDPLSVGH
ncbi:hypothetical protein BN1012_Phect2619 [Candidatus Phaeomarinobacter ectocarpi]|uniref:Uncharacterized protein n=1 Tax=Candidatus Phaeomarinibacter ectocarpi TaxID=1458461 RepID=X5MEC0_9HYPH|nr:hypothetical protein [Candidatus Phaeomarinobacter ectocarpi]CDO60832.1 hypothetical protein BN1012_Phect2619 [Candidatus Phaeomarinobacter ectocarpi]